MGPRASRTVPRIAPGGVRGLYSFGKRDGIRAGPARPPQKACLGHAWDGSEYRVRVFVGGSQSVTTLAETRALA